LLKILPFILFLTLSFYGNSQTNSIIEANLNDEEKLLTIEQSIEYYNKSNDTLSEVHLMDWANAFTNKATPLAKRFTEDYRRAFHFSSPDERGRTELYQVNSNNKPIEWSRPNEHPDVIVIDLTKPLVPNESVKIDLKYNVKIPHDNGKVLVIKI